MKKAKLERSIEEIRFNMLQGAESYFQYKGKFYWIEMMSNGNCYIVTDEEESIIQKFYSLSDLFNYARLEGNDILSVFTEIEFDFGGMFIRDKYASGMLAYKQIEINDATRFIKKKKGLILKYEDQKFLIGKNAIGYSLIQLLPVDKYKRTNFVTLFNLFSMHIVGDKSFVDIWESVIIEEVFSD